MPYNNAAVIHIGTVWGCVWCFFFLFIWTWIVVGNEASVYHTVVSVLHRFCIERLDT